jgi:hypothetical protein
MAIPVLQGDVGGPYTYPSTPPLTAPATMLTGSTKVFIGGRSVMLVGQANTTLGAIVASTLVSLKTFVEGAPLHLSGSVTNTSAGWLGGVLQGTIPNVQVT